MNRIFFTLLTFFLGLGLFAQEKEIKKTNKHLEKGQTNKLKVYIQKLRQKDHKSSIPDFLASKNEYYLYQKLKKEKHLHRSLNYLRKSHKKSKSNCLNWENKFTDSLYRHTRNQYEDFHEEHIKKRKFYGSNLLIIYGDSIHIYNDKPKNDESAKSIEPAHISKNEEELRKNLIKFAEQFIGTPYKWAGEKPEDGGFDCSGFVQYVFKNHNIELPHKASMIADSGVSIKKEKIKPGDVVAFGSKRSNGQHHVYHIGIVYQTEGELKVIHSVSRGVIIDPLGEGAYWNKNILFFRKLIEL